MNGEFRPTFDSLREVCTRKSFDFCFRSASFAWRSFSLYLSSLIYHLSADVFEMLEELEWLDSSDIICANLSAAILSFSAYCSFSNLICLLFSISFAAFKLKSPLNSATLTSTGSGVESLEFMFILPLKELFELNY